jgi:hypothetical protein
MSNEAAAYQGAASTTYTPVSDWLNTTSNAIQLSDNVAHYGQGGLCYNGLYYPWYTPYVWNVTAPVKIRLKLSEVERLREAARGDEALRATLQKFTAHIEIEVDF